MQEKNLRSFQNKEFSLCLISCERVKGQDMFEFDRQVKIDHRVQYFCHVNNLKLKQFLNNSKKR